MAKKLESPRMAALFDKRLHELNMRPVDVYHKMVLDFGEDAIASNHLYKVLAGGSRLSTEMLAKIAKSMRMDFDEALEQLKLDKAEKKGWLKVFPEANKTVQDVARLMQSMNKKDQEEMLQFAKIKAKAKH